MKIILSMPEENILLKNCKSYVELDTILSHFSSKEDIVLRLGLEDEAELRVLDNNGNDIAYNSDLIRSTLSFYEKNKGDEFVDWIYDSSKDKKTCDKNGTKLRQYFLNKLMDFSKTDKNDDMNVNNPEVKRLYRTCLRIIEQLEFFDGSYGTLDLFQQQITPFINEYVKKNGKYDYSYMRKFVSSLDVVYDYNFIKPKIDLISFSEEEQNKIIEDFNAKIHNYFYERKQVTFDDLQLDNQKEFLDEFDKKKLNL